MATASDIIERAFRKIGLKAKDQAIDADDEQHGLDTLNALMHGWRLFGIDSTHATMTSNDTFPLGTEFEEGTTYLLAERLSPDYVIPRSFDADVFFRAIQCAYLVLPTSQVDTTLTFMPSQIDREFGAD